MNTLKANLSAALLCTLVLGAPLMHRVWATPCNNMTPVIGNCGTESKCEGRGQAACLMTTGVYYEATGGISQQSRIDSYSKLESIATLKCTCDWVCEYDPIGMTCDKSGVQVPGPMGVPVCTTQKQYKSMACTRGGY